MNDQILKLDKHIASAWENVASAVKQKNRMTVQDALHKLAHLENLKAQQLALDQSIAASTSAGDLSQIASSTENKSQNGSLHQSLSESIHYSSRRKRPTIRPQEIRIGSFRKEIHMANQIPISTANWLIGQGKSLPTIPNFIHPSNSGFSRSASTKELVNGSFIEIGDDVKVSLQKARRLLDACGFRSLKLEVLFEDGSLKTS